MKKIYTTIIVIAITCIAITANATVITVSNNPVSAGQYSNLQTAINAAASGDTIYIHGSATSYGGITVTKRLTLIGAGYNVSGTQNNFNSILGNVDFSGNDGSVFSGLNIACFCNTSGINSISISRCNVVSLGLRGDGWIVENNVITSLYMDTPPISSCIIRNNFFQNNGTINGNGAGSLAGLIMDHNIIETSDVHFLANATLTNNIFFYSAASTWGNISNCTMNNNITASSVDITLPYGGTGSGNINGVAFSNLFVGNQTAPQYFASYDWHLQASSPGHNAATDGTDIGIYGGAYPMPNFTGASNIIPQMTLMQINNVSVPVNGSLNVHFKAKKQN